MPQAQALVNGFIGKYQSGDVGLNAFHKLAMEILRDGRIGLITEVANAYPLPEFEQHQDPERDMMSARLDAVRASLPGIYGPVHAASYRMQQTIKQVDAEKEAESPLVDYRKELTEALDKHPVWRAMIIHPEVTIRLVVLSRLGGSNNPIKEAAIVFALGDGNATVRQRARALLGEEPRVRHRSHYSTKDIAHRGTVTQAISQILELSTDDELRGFTDDPRSGVRYAAAIRLPPESRLWEHLAGDSSARVRRVVAEKVPMNQKEIVSLLLQDQQQSIRTIIGKRKLAEDVVIPVNAREQNRRELTQQMESETHGSANVSE